LRRHDRRKTRRPPTAPSLLVLKRRTFLAVAGMQNKYNAATPDTIYVKKDVEGKAFRGREKLGGAEGRTY
jgi:hypothetical protein